MKITIQLIRLKKTTKVCERCGSEIVAPANLYRRDGDDFCSVSCARLGKLFKLGKVTKIGAN